MNEPPESKEELERMIAEVELENLRRIFDPNRKIETDEELLALAGLTDPEGEYSASLDEIDGIH